MFLLVLLLSLTVYDNFFRAEQEEAGAKAVESQQKVK